MTRYVLHRVVQGTIAVLLLAVIVFVLSRITGDPLDLLLSADVPPELRARVAERLGLDKSYPEQFAVFALDLLKGDLGQSIRHGVPVWDLYVERFPRSLGLVAASMAVAFVVGVPLGVISAVNRTGLVGRLAGTVAVLGISLPNFWVALVLIAIFAVQLGLLPASRMGGLSSYILPVVTLSLTLVAGIMRLVRSSMLEVLDADFIKLARLKGLPEWKVVWYHALRNSMLPAISLGGTYFAALLGGAITIETVFAWPGVGRLLYESIQARDYPVVQGVIVVTGVLIVAMNLLVDLLYAFLDPRIRYA